MKLRKWWSVLISGVGVCLWLSSIFPPCAVAEQKVYGYYGGSALALAEAADAWVRENYPELQRTTRPADVTDAWESVSLSYTVKRTMPDLMGAAGATRIEEIQILQVSATVHKPRDGAAAGAALRAAKESFDFFLQDDSAHGESVQEQSLPEANAPLGSYAFYSVRTRLHAVAANVELMARLAEWSDPAIALYDIPRPDRKAIVAAMLAGLSGGSVAAGRVEVYPSAKLSPSNVGLIPASERLPARIVFSGAQAGDEVRFALAGKAAGELRGAGSAGESVTVRADSAGQAIAYYHYQSPGFQLLKPQTVGVQVSCGGQTLPAEIKVGLGLAFDQLKAVQGQSYANDTHAFTLSVKSKFHPDLNVALYLASAEAARVWPNLHLGVKMLAAWVNRPDGAVADEAFLGTTNIVAGDDGANFLVANQTPWYGPPGGKFFYPAVVMKSPGRHAYRINGRGAVLDNDGVFFGYIDEPMQCNDTLIILNRDDPESWYQSLACSLEASSDSQYLMLEAVKLVPVYGTIADQATTVGGLVCGVMQGDYEKSLLDLANWLGAEYLDNLMKPAVFNKLSPRQQDAVLVTKGIVTGTDNLKRAQTTEGLRGAQ